jgi:hypothetical protein
MRAAKGLLGKPKGWHSAGSPCTVNGCGMPSRSAGKCEDHLPQHRKDLRSKREKGICEYRMCDRSQLAKGLCSTHYEMQRRGESLRPIIGIGSCPLVSCQNDKRDDRAYCDRHKRISIRYNLTHERMRSLFDYPECANPKCDVAGPEEKYTYAVDHDHSCCDTNASSCGKCIRGLLCSKCNITLGMVGDNPETLLGLVEYLETYTVSW